MPVSDEKGGSVSHWLGDLKAGNLAAAQPLWERYFSRLVRLARSRLLTARRTAAHDEEDAALSAFHSFCEGVANGRFPQLADRDDLWKLLVVITARKAGAHSEHEARLKRGGGRLVSAADLPGSAFSGDDGSADDLFARILSKEPSPEFAAMAAEECARLLAKLDDDGLRKVAIDRMEGYSNDEIAERLGCARRTVARRLDLIRRAWEAEGA